MNTDVAVGCSALAERELSAVLVTDLFNVRYLCGFTGSSGALLVLADGQTWLATDGRYDTQAAEQSPDVERVIRVKGRSSCSSSPARKQVDPWDSRTTRVGGARARLSKDFGDLSAVGSLVTDLRLSKDEHELDLLRQACAATDEALAVVLPRLRPGVSERQIGRWLDDAMRDRTYRALVSARSSRPVRTVRFRITSRRIIRWFQATSSRWTSAPRLTGITQT